MLQGTRRTWPLLVLCALAALWTSALAPCPARAQCDSSLIYHDGGVARTLALRGSFAYVGFAGELRIYNVTNPAAPTISGRVPLPGTVIDLDISGTYAYAALDEGGFAIIDVSVVSNPTLVAQRDSNAGGDVDRIAASTSSGKMLLVVGVDAEIWNISNPASPTFAAEWDPSGFVADVDVVQNTGYVLGNTGEFEAIDLTTPGSPTLLDAVSLGGSIYEELARDGSFFAAISWDGLDLIDAVNPAVLTVPNQLNVGGIVRNVTFGSALGQRLVHFEDGSDNLETYDVTNPAAPTFRSRQPIGAIIDDLAGLGDKLFILDFSSLEIFNYASPASPVLAGTIEPSQTVSDVVSVGNYLIFAGLAELLVVDASTATAPSAPTALPVNADAINFMHLDGEHLYLACQNASAGKLIAYDFADPLSPVLLGTLNLPEVINDVTVRNNRAYFIDRDGVVGAVNVADPTAMRSLGHVDALGGLALSTRIESWEGHVAVWDDFADIVILNVENPADMRVVDTIESRFGEYVQGFVTRDTLGFVGQSDGRVDIYELADPSNRQLVSFFESSTGLTALGQVETMIVVVDSQGRARLVNTANPASPNLVIDTPIGGEPNRFARRGTTLWGVDDTSYYGIYGIALPAFPRFSNLPDDAITCPSTSSLTFRAPLANPNAAGGATFQWRRNGNNLSNNATFSGVTTSVLTITNPGVAQVGNYDCVATNTCGSATTAPASNSFALGLTITIQPQDQGACRQGSATFSLTGIGSAPYTYQWESETPPGSGTFAPLADAVGPRLTISGTQTRFLTISANPGQSLPLFVRTSYRCVVSNVCETVTSQPAALSFCVADVDDGSLTGQCDDAVTIDDLLYYIDRFFAGDVAADVDDGTFTGTTDGGVTVDDLIYFLDRFGAGC